MTPDTTLTSKDIGLKWPRTMGRYSQRWQAYQARNAQNNSRFYVIEEEGTWLLMLGR